MASHHTCGAVTVTTWLDPDSAPPVWRLSIALHGRLAAVVGPFVDTPDRDGLCKAEEYADAVLERARASERRRLGRHRPAPVVCLTLD